MEGCGRSDLVSTIPWSCPTPVLGRSLTSQGVRLTSDIRHFTGTTSVLESRYNFSVFLLRRLFQVSHHHVIDESGSRSQSVFSLRAYDVDSLRTRHPSLVSCVGTPTGLSDVYRRSTKILGARHCRYPLFCLIECQSPLSMLNLNID